MRSCGESVHCILTDISLYISLRINAGRTVFLCLSERTHANLEHLINPNLLTVQCVIIYLGVKEKTKRKDAAIFADADLVVHGACFQLPLIEWNIIKKDRVKLQEIKHILVNIKLLNKAKEFELEV